MEQVLVFLVNIFLIFWVVLPLIFWLWFRVMTSEHTDKKGESVSKTSAEEKKKKHNKKQIKLPLFNFLYNQTKDNLVLLLIILIIFVLFMLLPYRYSIRGKLDLAILSISAFFPLAFFTVCFSEEIKKTLLIILFLGSVVSGIIAYGTLIEAKRIVITKEIVKFSKEEIANFPSNFSKKIVIVSDIHTGSMQDEDYVKSVVGRLNKLVQDEYSDLRQDEKILLILAGDFVTSKKTEAEMLYELANLDRKYKTFAVLGNHDFDYIEPENVVFSKTKKVVNSENFKLKEDELAFEISNVLVNDGIKVLRNENYRLSEKSVISGLDDIWALRFDIEKALKNCKKEDFVILVSHNPDVMLLLDENPGLANNVDLVVSGHTHGGEIRIPTFGLDLGLGKRQSIPLLPLPDRLGEKYDKGLFFYNVNEEKSKTLPLYITSGVGNTATRIRLFNPPEISILDLQAE